MRVALASYCMLTAMLGPGTANARDAPEPTSDPLADPLPAATPQARGTPAAEPVASVVQVVLNGNHLPAPIIIASEADELFLPADLISARQIRTASEFRTIGGRRFVSAASLKATSIDLDPTSDTLWIECAADCFQETLISARPIEQPDVSPVATGAFLNYDLFAQGGDIERRAGAFLEAGLFSSVGTGVTNFACTLWWSEDDCIRLDTTWTIDRPTSATRLELGDTTTGSASWGYPARFGGVRWGTDFSLTPDFITFPTPSISGDAILPGVVDVIINDTQRYATDVPAGPFTLTDLPVVTGAGSTQLVMTDVLGRQSMVTADYYTAPQLLKPGLKNWSVEAGFLRKDFGLSSSRYDEGFLAGRYAFGVTDHVTLEARSEISAAYEMAGASGTILNPALGIVQVSAAMSQSDGGTGTLVDLSHEWRSSSLSLGSSVNYSTKQFRQFGQGRPSARLTARTFASYTDSKLGAVSLSWTYQDERIRGDVSTFGVRYTRSLGPMSLNVSAIQLTGADDATIAALSITLPLSGGKSAGVGADYRNGSLGGDVRFRRSVAPAGGLGYSARVSTGMNDRYEGGIDYRTQAGDASAVISQIDSRTAGRLTVRGGAAVIDGIWVAAPSITNSLAVVNVGDQPGVEVYQDRQPMGRTNARGQIVLTRLRPFERNVLSFDPLDVGLEAGFDQTEAVVMPGLRTGHRVSFEVNQSRNVLAYIVRPDGMPVSSGGRIEDTDTGKTYPIGQDGRIYLADALSETRLKFISNKVICEARIELGPAPSPAPYEDVGDITCVPIGRLR